MPKHLLTGVADNRSQRSNGVSGVEVKDTEKIFMLKVFAGVQTTAGHQGIGGADGSGIFECHAYIVIIILLKERIGKDVKNIPAVVIPVFCHQFFRDALQLLTEVIPTGDAISLFQCFGHDFTVFLPVLPEVGASGIFLTGSIGDIKDIFQLGRIAAGVDESDALRTTPYIAAHLLVPEVVVCTGGSIRSLCVDHQLLMERVFIEPCGSIQKCDPVGKAARNLPRGLVRHLGVEFQLTCHPYPPRRSRGKAQAPHIPHRS
ncbi:MAG: hypothetical protein IKC03_04500 [Oscillospiraceae bacterium]|nr:hypothetical protein [Oscillospiraceae bacterium]